jgi:hypothetical protein
MEREHTKGDNMWKEGRHTQNPDKALLIRLNIHGDRLRIIDQSRCGHWHSLENMSIPSTAIQNLVE